MEQVGVVIEGLDGTGGCGHIGSGWNRWVWSYRDWMEQVGVVI